MYIHAMYRSYRHRRRKQVWQVKEPKANMNYYLRQWQGGADHAGWQSMVRSTRYKSPETREREEKNVSRALERDNPMHGEKT